MKKNPFLSKKRILPTSFIIGYVLLCLTSSFCFAFSQDFKLDRLAYSINDYNKHIKSTDFISPTVTIKKKDQTFLADKNYFDLYKTFYYGFMADHILQFSVIDYRDSFNNVLRFHTQQTFSISQEKNGDGLYSIDGNLYGAYFSNELLGEQGNLISRNGCDTFAFVSDKYADQLLKTYNLTNYSQLILDSTASVLAYTGMDGSTYKASINNVVSSSFKNGIVATQDNPYFALIFLNGKTVASMDIQFQIGLKSSPYCIKNVLRTIRQYGYNYDEYDINFETVDYGNLRLFPNTAVDDKYKDYLENKDDSVLFYAITSFFAVLISFAYARLFKQMPKEMDCVLSIITISFLLANIFFSFIYSYYGFLLFPTIVETFALVYRLFAFVKRISNSIVYEIKI